MKILIFVFFLTAALAAVSCYLEQFYLTRLLLALWYLEIDVILIYALVMFVRAVVGLL